MRIDSYLKWECLDNAILNVSQNGLRLRTATNQDDKQAARILASALKALATFSVVMLASSLIILAGPPVVCAAIYTAAIGLGARTAYLEYRGGQFSSPIGAVVGSVFNAIGNGIRNFRR